MDGVHGVLCLARAGPSYENICYPLYTFENPLMGALVENF
jgi:hypothetical protein